jgi:hypothetical protein
MTRCHPDSGACNPASGIHLVVAWKDPLFNSVEEFAARNHRGSGVLDAATLQARSAQK